MIKTNVRKINSQIVKRDLARRKLAERNQIENFIRTYSKDYDPPNLNSSSYWNSIFKSEGNLASQSPMTQDKIRIIASYIPTEELSILDLGIGQGFVEEILCNRQVPYKLHGIDISDRSISRAKKMFKGKFIIANVLNIDKHYKKRSFDMVLALELVEHISPSEIFSFYKKIYNTLKDKGTLIVSIPLNEGLQFMNVNPSAHVRDYSYSVISKELELNGFEIVAEKYLYAFKHNYKLKKLLARFITNKWKPNSLIIIARKVSKKSPKKKSVK